MMEKTPVSPPNVEASQAMVLRQKPTLSPAQPTPAPGTSLVLRQSPSSAMVAGKAPSSALVPPPALSQATGAAGAAGAAGAPKAPQPVNGLLPPSSML